MPDLAGDRFRNRIDGTAASDIIVGLNGVDRLYGGGGGDFLDAGSGADQLYGGDGADMLYAFDQALGDDLDADQLYGGAGSDMLFAGVGDTVDGGAGTDTLDIDFTRATAGLTVNFSGLLAGGSLVVAGSTLSGIERVSSVTLTAFDDTLTIGTATGQNVTVAGGAGADRITGSTGFDTIFAGDLYGESETAIDTLDGGAGDDMLYAGVGDNVDGNIGNDTLFLDLSGATAGLSVNLAPLFSGGTLSLAGGTLTRIEQVRSVVMTRFADTVTVGTTTIGTTIAGGDGADTITGGAGADTLFGSGYAFLSEDGTGDDGLVDMLYGGGGGDTIHAGFGDTADGGTGTDTLTLDLSRATAALTLNLSPLYTGGTVTIGGGTLTGFEYLNGVLLGAYDDTLVLGGPAGRGSYVAGGGGFDTITGGAGDDFLYGNDDRTFADTLRGGAGSDYITAGVNDVVDGGAGTDTLELDLEAANIGIVLDIGAAFTGGTQAVFSGSFTGFESVSYVTLTQYADTLTVGSAAYSYLAIYAGAGADTVNGGSGSDEIYGGNDPLDTSDEDVAADDGAADVLYGGAGDDRITAGIGDSVYGGSGQDELSLDLRRATAGLVVDFTAAFTGGSVTVAGGTLNGLERLDELYLSRFDDVVTVAPVTDEVYAGAGNDRVTGSARDDELAGEAGDDILFGGTGDDELVGGSGRDRLEGGAGNDVIFGDFDMFDTDIDEQGVHREQAVGEADDLIIGGAGSDEVHGGFGRDTMLFTDFARRHGYAVGGAHGTVTYGNDTDSLDSVETLVFRDGMYLSLDEDGPYAEIARLYDTTLQRLPDLSGLDYHAGRLATGTATLLDVARDFLNGPEFQAATGGLTNAAFVDYVYRNALGRQPDSGGSAYWTGQLDNGFGRAQLLVQFSESAEHRIKTQADIVDGWFVVDANYKSVALMYDSAFGRRPDAGGITYWAEALKTGTQTLSSLATTFAGSAEFQNNTAGLNNAQFVNYMYVNTLDRPADQGGTDYWTGRLNAGLARSDMLLAFATGAEHAQLYAPFYADGIVLA